MTNAKSNNATSLEIQSNELHEKTTMQSIYELLGFHYYKTRAVFDVDGKELVYMNDNVIGRVKIYLDGYEIHKGWTWLPGVLTDLTANYQGHDYRIFTRINNWLTLSQKITVIVDDSKAQTKLEPVLGGLKGMALFHSMVGPIVIGVLVGVAAKYFSA